MQIRIPRFIARFLSSTSHMIYIIVVFIVVAALFPVAMSQITNTNNLLNSNKNLASSTTTWNTGVMSIFNIMILILPIMVIIGVVIHIFGYGFGYNEYGNTVIERIVHGENNFDGNEQRDFEAELNDMYLYFKKDV